MPPTPPASAAATPAAKSDAAQEAVSTILAPWLVPGYRPPANASPKAKAYAQDVAILQGRTPSAPPRVHSTRAPDVEASRPRLPWNKWVRDGLPPRGPPPRATAAEPSTPPSDRRPREAAGDDDRDGMPPLCDSSDDDDDDDGAPPASSKPAPAARPKASWKDPTRDPSWKPEPPSRQHRTAVNLTPEEAPWRPDTDQSAAHVRPQVNVGSATPGMVSVAPRDGRSTMRVAYLFSGRHRRASIAEELKALCEHSGSGLEFEELDILIGGSAHNLLDAERQNQLIARIEEGYFDLLLLSPPCGSWSRANWRGGRGPKPCRCREHPWGYPNSLAPARRRADQGNEFILFSIRAIEAAHRARTARGVITRVFLEHPEDLGRTPGSDPASIWQVPEIRRFGDPPFGIPTCAGHQCQFANVDYAKPTRILSDVPGTMNFGPAGWPQLDNDFRYHGPLDRCGHVHGDPTTGVDADGNFNSSSKAAYPAGMCRFIAVRAFCDWKQRSSGPEGRRKPPGDCTTSRTNRGGSEQTQPSSSSNDAASHRRQRDDDDDDDDKPIREGHDHLKPIRLAEADHPTTDEERELPGFFRPKRRSGWWGRGPPLHTEKKGVRVPLVDGGGLCSPGRWAPRDRILPNAPVVGECRDAVWSGFLGCVENFDKKDLMRELYHTAQSSAPGAPLCWWRSCRPWSSRSSTSSSSATRASSRARGS